MPLWHKDYFELKTYLKKSRLKKGALTDLLLPKQRKIKLPCERCSPLYQELRNILVTRDRKLRPREISANGPC